MPTGQQRSGDAIAPRLARCCDPLDATGFEQPLSRLHSPANLAGGVAALPGYRVDSGVIQDGKAKGPRRHRSSRQAMVKRDGRLISLTVDTSSAARPRSLPRQHHADLKTADRNTMWEKVLPASFAGRIWQYRSGEYSRFTPCSVIMRKVASWSCHFRSRLRYLL